MKVTTAASDRKVFAVPDALLGGGGMRSARSGASELLFERVHALHHRDERSTDGIGHKDMIEVGTRRRAGFVTAGHDLAGHADDDRIGRDGPDYDGIGADAAVGADYDIA